MALKYPIGEYRHRVTVQPPTPATPNVYNEKPATFADSSKRWARVATLSGKALWSAQQAQSDVTDQVNLRYFPGLTSRHRLLFGNRVLNIASVADLNGLHQEYELQCIEAPPKAGS